MSIQAYQQAAVRAESPRETEWRAFSVATAALLRAEEAGLSAAGIVGEALYQNRRLWSTLALDCAQDGNALPAPVRAQIISLALWVDKHSTKVAKGEAAIGDLIAVNRSIMEGLSGR